jgi:hypothetical protein
MASCLRMKPLRNDAEAKTNGRHWRNHLLPATFSRHRCRFLSCKRFSTEGFSLPPTDTRKVDCSLNDNSQGADVLLLGQNLKMVHSIRLISYRFKKVFSIQRWYIEIVAPALVLVYTVLGGCNAVLN